MSATPAVYNAAMKEGWTQETLENQLIGGSAVLEKVENSGKKHLQGKKAITAVKVGRNGGITVLPSGGGNLNDAGSQQQIQAEWYLSHQFQTISIDSETIDTTTGAQAIVNVVDTEIEGALEDMRFNLSRQVYGSGDSLIAQCGTTTATTVVNVNSTSGQNAIKRGWIFKGMSVDIGTTADETAIASNRTVTAVDPTNYTFTITGAAVTTTSSHYVSVRGSRDGTTGYELGGFGKIISTTSTLGAIDPAVYTEWQGSVDSTSASLAVGTIENLEQQIYEKGGEDTDMMVLSPKQKNRFYQQLSPQVRYASDTKISSGGWKSVMYDNKELVMDRHCPDEQVILGAWKNLEIVTAGQPTWQNDQTGGNELVWQQGTTRYVAMLRYRLNLITNKRRSFARCTALTAS